MTKTKWTIEADQITLFPNRQALIVGSIVTALVIGLGFFARGELMGSTRTFIMFLLIFGLVAVLALAASRNKVVFDRIDKVMIVKFLGFLTIKRIPYSDIAVINSVTTNGGGYAFHVFRKSNRHGKGIRISSHYSKDNDQNAAQLLNEVFPLLERDLAESAIPEVSNNVPLTSFEHYKIEDGVYTVKASALFLIIIGLALIGMGFYFIARPDSLTSTDSNRFVMTVLPILFGLFLAFSATKKITLNTNNRTISHSLIAGIRKKEYSFDDFQQFNILRKTTNFVHTGTEVGLVLKQRDTEKLYVIPMASFKNTKKIERFIAETSKILGVPS